MYWDDFEVGAKYYPPSLTMKADEIADFANAYDPLLLHVDEEFAKKTMFGGIIASGLHTMCAIWRQWLTLDLYGSQLICGLGMDDLAWLAPVRAGDVLKSEVEVLALEPDKKPCRGRLVLGFVVTNQENKEVMRFKVRALQKRKRPAEI